MSEAQSYHQSQCQYEAVIPEKTAQTSPNCHYTYLAQYVVCELLLSAIPISQFNLVDILHQMIHA